MDVNKSENSNEQIWEDIIISISKIHWDLISDTVYSKWTSAQPHNNQFQNLFNLIVKNDLEKSEMQLKILKQQVARQRQAFHAIKQELYARNGKMHQNLDSNENFAWTITKRETNEPKQYSFTLKPFLQLVDSVLPIYAKFHPTKKQSSKKKTTKPPRYEEYSDNTDSLSSVESPELPADYDEQVELFEAIRLDILNNTAEGRQPNPLPPPNTRKRLIADLTRDLIDDLITKMVITFGYRDREKISFIIDDDYHTKAINMDCYKRVTSTFSKFCINIEKNPYMNRFTNIFVNICNAKWLPGYKINNGLRYLCTGINRRITGTV